MTGYSGTPLLRKLGIKPGYTVLLLNEADHYLELLGEFPVGAEVVSYVWQMKTGADLNTCTVKKDRR